MSTGWPHIFATQYPTIALQYLDDQFNTLLNASTATTSISGAGLVGFVQLSAGAQATDLQTRGRKVVYVTDFTGVDPTGVSDSTTGIQNAISSLSSGGTLYFPPGTYLCGALTVSVAGISIVGAGEQASFIETTSTTIDLLTVSADAFLLHNIQLKRSGAASTAGSAINISSGALATLRKVTLTSFYDNFKTTNADQWVVDDCYIVNAVRYNMFIQNVNTPDAGDSAISNSIIAGAASSSIRYESSGGLKVSNCKILNGTWGIDLSLASGANTSDLLVSNCSIESQTSGGVQACLQATGTFTQIVLSGLQISLPANNTTGILLNSGITDAAITGCVLRGTTTGSIGVDCLGTTAQHIISGNNFDGWATAISIASGCSWVAHGCNQFHNCTVAVEDDTLGNAPRGAAMQTFRSAMDISSSVTYTNLFQVALANYSAVEVKVVYCGIVNGLGSFSRTKTQLANVETGNCTMTSVTDVSGGFAIDVQFDVTTTAGSVLIGVRRNSAGGGTSVQGTIDLLLTGRFNKVMVL